MQRNVIADDDETAVRPQPDSALMGALRRGDFRAVADRAGELAEDGDADRTLQLIEGAPEEYIQLWIQGGWIPDAALTMLNGDGGAGKSWLSVKLAVAVTTGSEWLDGIDHRSGAGMPIVYATWEDTPAQIKGRLYSLSQQGFHADKNLFHIADMRSEGHIWTQDLTESGKLLRDAAESVGARLLVIDTFGVAFGGNEIDRSQIGVFFSDWAAWATEADCAILLVAHPQQVGSVVRKHRHSRRCQRHALR